MKELSIEGNGNYKAYYTELINRLEAVKDAIKKLNYGIAMDIMCKPYHEFQVTTHSELKESEGEKIRKELISLFEDDAKGVKIRYTGEDCERWIAWLEKQGEKKPADEPKFKVGDWVVNTITDNVEQIIEVTNNEYICSGTLIVSFDNQHLLKKWTIQDARDGDILVCGKDKRPFIFKGLLDKLHPDSPVAYCGIDCVNKFQIATDISWWTDEEVEPATKEQRDTLIKAMADAGYTFDFEKKELKKIEQKPVWSQEDEKTINKMREHFMRILGDRPDFTEDKRYEEFIEFIDRLKSLRPQSQTVIDKEFEDTIREIKTRIAQCNGFNRKHREEVFGLLDSLRPQNRWKPSDKQMKALSNAGNSFRPFEEGHKVLWSLYNDLKKLMGE